MRLFGNDDVPELPPLVHKAGPRRTVPFLQREQPELLGSGDRCKRVIGSCYDRSDPVVAQWLEKLPPRPASPDISAANALRSDGDVYAGLGVRGAACLMLLLLAAAAAAALWAAPREQRWRQRTKGYTLPARLARLAVAVSCVAVSTQGFSGAMSSVSAVMAVGMLG
jgi:hypothetical protein